MAFRWRADGGPTLYAGWAGFETQSGHVFKVSSFLQMSLAFLSPIEMETHTQDILKTIKKELAIYIYNPFWAKLFAFV